MRNNIGEARRSYALSLPSGRFTQKDAAKQFGTSLSTYKKWEQGIGMLNGDVLCRMADFYGCSTDYLLCRTDVPDFEEVRCPIPDLSDDERQLIDAYRSSNAQGRATMLAVASVQPGMEGQHENLKRRAV